MEVVTRYARTMTVPLCAVAMLASPSLKMQELAQVYLVMILSIIVQYVVFLLSVICTKIVNFLILL